MKTLVFVACILAAVSADLIIDYKRKTSTFDIKELLDFHRTLTDCALKLGLSEIATPETLYCLSIKKNLINGKHINFDKGLNYKKKLVRDITMTNKLIETNYKCREVYKERDKFEGSEYEKNLKLMECFIPLVKYALRQLIPYENNI